MRKVMFVVAVSALAVAPAVAASEIEDLEDLLEIKRVNIDHETDELAKELFYLSYQRNPVWVVPRALIMNVPKETLFQEFEEANYGYEFDSLKDYVFVNISADRYGGVSAIYKPESNDVESSAHKYIRDLRIPDVWAVAGDEYVIADIAGLFDRDAEFKSLEGLERAAYIRYTFFVGIIFRYMAVMNSASRPKAYTSATTPRLYIGLKFIPQ